MNEYDPNSIQADPPSPSPLPPGSLQPVTVGEVKFLQKIVRSELKPVHAALSDLSASVETNVSDLDEIFETVEGLQARKTTKPARRFGWVWWAILIGLGILLIGVLLFSLWLLVKSHFMPSPEPNDSGGETIVTPTGDEVRDAAAQSFAIEHAGRSQLYIDAGTRAKAGEFKSLDDVRSFIATNKKLVEANAFAAFAPHLEQFNGIEFTDEVNQQIGDLLTRLGEGFK